MDAALMASDALEKDLQKRIAEVYGDALKRAVRNNRLFLTNVKKLDARAAELEKGGWTSEKIEKWRKEEVLRLLRQQRLVQNIADEMNRAGIEIAPEIKSRMAEVYKVNSDMTYQRINGKINADFSLIPKKQIPIILDDTQPVFSKIAYRHLGQNKTIRAALQREMAQAAILGESQEKIIKRIQKVTGQAEYQARRVAQTERNRVQSQARADALHEAAQAGVIVTKKWSARMRNTRDSHAALNGVEIPENEKFRTIWGNELRYPGDPEAPASEVCNCHCVLIPYVKMPGEKWQGGESAKERQEPVPPKEVLAGAEKGSPKTFEEADTYHVNPNYGSEEGYDINCQTCVPVFEARLRGYDVEALPNKKGSACQELSRRTNLIWIDPKTGKHPEYILDIDAQTPKKYLAFIKNTVQKGERYSLEFSWKGRRAGGHIVNLDINENGKLRIKDNQRGKKERSEWIGDEQVLAYLSQMKYNTTVYGYKLPTVPKLLRLDILEFDKEFAAKIMKAVK